MSKIRKGSEPYKESLNLLKYLTLAVILCLALLPAIGHGADDDGTCTSREVGGAGRLTGEPPIIEGARSQDRIRRD